MEVFKNVLLALWTNHRKKLVAFVLGLLFAAIASLSGIPLSEIQDAAKEAASKPAPVVIAPPQVAAPVVQPVVETK